MGEAFLLAAIGFCVAPASSDFLSTAFPAFWLRGASASGLRRIPMATEGLEGLSPDERDGLAWQCGACADAWRVLASVVWVLMVIAQARATLP